MKEKRATARVATGEFGFPDIVTPTQFVDQERRCSQVRPEIYLMIAVLEDALVVHQRAAEDDRPEVRREFDEVRRWFESRDSKPLYSFESICEVLGLDADGVRRVLRGWQETRRRTHPHGWRRIARYRDGVGGRRPRAAAPGS